MIYIDTNVWIYAATAHPKYGPACKTILEGIEKGEIEAVISTQVLSEVAGVLYQRYHVRDPTPQLRAILSYPMKIVDVTPEIVLRAAECSRDYGILPYDGIHVASALSLLVDEILSADAELDKVGVIKRIDPLAFASKGK
jgi:predicted nucleic acid-binding protein